MKLLFVTSRFPIPIRKGDQVVLFNRLKYFSKNHDVTLLTYGIKDKYYYQLKEYGIDVHYSKFSFFYSFISLFTSIFNNNPIQVAIFKQPQFIKHFKALDASSDFDLIHINLLRLSFLCDYTTTKVFIDYIDSMQYNLMQIIPNKRFPINLIYKYDLFKMRDYELHITECYPGAFVSPKDLEYISYNKNIVVAPNGVDSDSFIPSLSNDSTICFSGNLSYIPNIEALYFLLPVIRELRKKYPEYRLKVVGKGASNKLINNISGDDVLYLGEVDDIATCIANSFVAVVPMEFASGIQNKALESMSCGLPVIMSEKVRAPIGCINNLHCLIANTPDELLSRLVFLINNKSHATELGINARKFVVNNFSWNNSNSIILNVYSSIFHEHKCKTKGSL